MFKWEFFQPEHNSTKKKLTGSMNAYDEVNAALMIK